MGCWGKLGCNKCGNQVCYLQALGPRILERISCLFLTCHRQVHTTTNTYFSIHCVVFHIKCASCPNISYHTLNLYITGGLVVSACHYKSTSLVTKFKNRFPHFALFGEGGVQQMWKPSLLPRSFGPRILDNISCLAFSCHRQVHSKANA